MSELSLHESHTWAQVGMCVYCDTCHVRLYQGELPVARRPACDGHDWDMEAGMGFYGSCRKCGAVEWFE